MTESSESNGRWLSGHVPSGAYVLDALEPEERATFEAHLAHCALCRHDVRTFRETLAGMKRLIAQPPPEALRASILERIHGLPQLPPGDD